MYNKSDNIFRSLLLPINVKKIKILNASDLKVENFKITTSKPNSSIFKKTMDTYAMSSSESVDGKYC